MGQAGALAERSKYADEAALSGLPFGPHDLVSIDLTILNGALDLTAPSVQRTFGVTTAQLRADGPEAYELCCSIADIARAQGVSCCSCPPRRSPAQPISSCTKRSRRRTVN